MVASINSNLPAAAAAMGYNNAQSTASAAMNRINTGLRINSAKDDAAGSTILTQIKTQYNSNVVAIRNTNDGVSLMQTAEVGVKAIETKVGRLRELAMAASNGTQTAASRDAMVKEVKLLLTDINTLAEKTNFNGVKLLDGSFNNATFQVGANTGDTKMASLGNASASKMGSADTSAVTTAQNAGTTALKEGAFSLNGVLIGPSLAAADTASTASAAGSSIAKAAAVNARSAQTGVTATVNATEVGGKSMTAAALTGSAVINGVTINLQTTTDTASSRAAVVAAINAKAIESGVTAVDTGSDKGGVKLIAADGRNISLTLNTVTGAATGLGTSAANGVAEVSSGSITLNSDKAIVITSNLNGAAGTGGIKDAGLTVGTFKAQTAYASATAATGGAESMKSFASGDFKINGVIVGASLATSDTASYSFKTTDAAPADQRDSKATSGISRAAAINALSEQTGVTATVNATTVQGATSTMTVGATSGSLLINGVSTAVITTTASSTTAQNRKATVDAINAISDRTGVIATDSNDDTKGVTLSAADGRNITAVQANTGTLTAASTGLGIDMTAAAATPLAGTAIPTPSTRAGVAMTAAASSGTITINGIATATITTTGTAATDRDAVVAGINAISAQTGVVANNDGTGVTLTAADGRAIAAPTYSGTLVTATTGLNGGAATVSTVGGTLMGGTYTSTLTLSSAKAFTIEAGTTDAGTDALNLKVGTYGAGRSGGSLDMIDLSTAEGAVAALTTIDNAIASLSNTKSAIGAIQKSFIATAEDLAGQNFALKATSDTMEQSDFIADNAELAAASLRADAANYAFTKALEQQNKLQGLMR
ncbi:hypothetical protein LHU53_15020 [Rhodoferax sp. U2-2l]|uniref:flagellin N-terminal helical domain-containing protein n=1 Tax=Rhodoferax sp. U2-2l TaxID=2884000 RepID=UPI001D0BBD0F|nr:flagellin [Rhodoferax sp. U2-2l]MCB8748214.1 hypothetical protein [Rhodoferax sp. U2-2l]